MIRIAAAVALLLTVALEGPVMARQSSAVSPSFAYIEASGCEGLFLYAWNEPRSEVLTLRIDRNTVKLAQGTTALNLATTGDGVAVRVEVTASPRGTMPYCSAAGQSTGDQPSIWTAKAGIVRIDLRKRAGTAITPVMVTLDDLIITSPEGRELRARRTIRFTAVIADLAP
jgi:hypothetical protein